MLLCKGDWILVVDGRVLPCRPSTFDEHYEQAESLRKAH